jgi:hypothetical protein
MKSLLAVLLIMLALSATASCNENGEKAATDSANHWLEQIDDGDYAASWETTAPMFKSAISKD